MKDTLVDMDRSNTVDLRIRIGKGIHREVKKKFVRGVVHLQDRIV